MPNHVTNVLTITGDNDQRVKELMDTLFDNDGNFDFDNFLPMPNELSEVTSPVRIVSEDERNALIAEYERKELAGELHPFDSKTFPLTQELQDEYIARFGCDNWYDWANENWGTKWGAYDSHRNSDDECTFMTAWNTPFPAMVKLSEMYPDLVFTVQYADEDFGYNVGEYTIIAGDVINEYSPAGGDIEALKMAMEITGDDYVIDADYINEVYEDEGVISDYLKVRLDLAYDMRRVDNYHVDLLEYLKGLAIADNENYEYLNKLIPSDVQ